MSTFKKPGNLPSHFELSFFPNSIWSLTNHLEFEGECYEFNCTFVYTFRGHEIVHYVYIKANIDILVP